MKILFIMHTSLLDGSTFSLFNLMRELQKKCVEMVLVIPGNNKLSDDFIQYLEGIKVDLRRVDLGLSVITSFPQRKKSLLRWFLRIIKLPFQKIISKRKLIHIINETHPDIIHTNSGVVHEGFSVAQKMRIPHVWHLREYQTLDSKYKILPSLSAFRKMLRKSYVITITNDIRKYFWLIDYFKAKTIYNGILSHDDTTIVFPKKKYFFMSSRVAKAKGHLEVIKAFEIVHKTNPDYELWIAGFGDYDYLKLLHDTLETMSCKNSVKFLGFRKDAVDLMAYAKALIVASSNEGFGRMTAEAAFKGCMVIGKNTAGTKEILDAVGGISYLGDQSELALKMQQVITMSEDEYRKKIIVTQQKAVSLYSIEANGNNIYNFYLKILDDYGKSK